MSAHKEILISGASGMIGQALAKELRSRGHDVKTLSRHSGDFQWDVSAGEMDATALDGIDCVVHLAGEPIAQRWSPSAKRKIMDSRVKGTELLVAAALKQPTPPDLIMASGANFYGYDLNEPVDEDAKVGDGFLAEVCRLWEQAAAPLAEASGRLVMVRTGVVLSSNGGALAKMLPAFKLGVGGRIGSGEQRMSWISLEDLVGIYVLAIENSDISGPVNAVSPKSVTNQKFTEALGQVLHRPTLIPVPEAMVRWLFGEMGRETILADLEVIPRRLMDLGYQWQTAEIGSALSATLTSKKES